MDSYQWHIFRNRQKNAKPLGVTTNRNRLGFGFILDLPNHVDAHPQKYLLHLNKAIFISLVQESLLATLSGTLVAMVVALVFLDKQTVPFSIGTFAWCCPPAVILTGMWIGVLLGTAGILPPSTAILETY